MIVAVPLLLLVFALTSNHGFALAAEGNNATEELVLQPRALLQQFNAAVKNREALSPKYLQSACSKRQKKVYLAPGDAVYISSQDYPEFYPGRSKCKWKFTTAKDNYVGIYCYDFDLEPSNRKKKCSDYLKLNGDKFCGSESPVYISTANILIAQFIANKKRPFYRGFDCIAMSLSEFYSTTTTAAPATKESTLKPNTPDPNTPQPGSWKCGIPNRVSRIVGGVETTVNEYPWQAGLIYKGSGKISSFCGGSVISSKYIVTAAHCTEAIEKYSISYEVLLGGHCLSSPPSSQMKMAVDKYIQHSNYNSKTMDNDIALIPLKKSIDFDNSDIRPICLPPKNAGDFVGDVATVIGWGALKEGKNGPDCLQEVDVPVITDSKCDNWIGGGLTKNMICAGYEKGKKDSCQGDSGGPLFFDSGCGYEQLGVVSFGYGCAREKSPGVYVRVTKYIDWIQSKLGSSTTYSCR